MRKISTPLISVIICTFNTKSLTLECIQKLNESIRALKKHVEIIVVDNGTDGTGKLLKQKFQFIKLIEPGINTGFARGNNLGIAEANKLSKYFLLLNTDAFVSENTLVEAVEFIESHSDCDLLGCKLVFENGYLQPSAGYLPTPFSVFTWALGIDLIFGFNRILKPFHPNYPDFFKSEKKVGWVTGAFWFMKRQVVKKTQGFDENYFMYGEEIEWCKRIENAGFNIWYTPKFEIVHLFSQSSGSTRNAFLREIEGIYYYMNRYYPDSKLYVKPVVRLGMFARAIAFGLMGNFYRARVHWDAAKI